MTALSRERDQTVLLNRWPRVPHVLYVLCSGLHTVCHTINAVQLVNKQLRDVVFEVIELWLRKCRAAPSTTHPL